MDALNFWAFLSQGCDFQLTKRYFSPESPWGPRIPSSLCLELSESGREVNFANQLCFPRSTATEPFRRGSLERHFRREVGAGVPRVTKDLGCL